MTALRLTVVVTVASLGLGALTYAQSKPGATGSTNTAPIPSNTTTGVGRYQYIPIPSGENLVGNVKIFDTQEGLLYTYMPDQTRKVWYVQVLDLPHATTYMSEVVSPGVRAGRPTP